MRTKIGWLFILKIIKMPLNILLLSLIAKYFGISLDRDIWLVAIGLVTIVDAAVWGPINETFRARFVMIKEKFSEEYALQQSKSLLFYMILITLGIILIVYLSSPLISSLLAPNYTHDETLRLSSMIRIVFPVLLLNQVALIGISILNTYDIFYVPEIVGFFSVVINIMLLIILTPHIGIYSLLVSHFSGILLLVLFVVFTLYRKEIPLFKLPLNFKFEGFKIYFIFSVAFFIPYFFGQINSIVEKKLSILLGEGVVSSLEYSSKIPYLLNAVFLSIIASVLVPRITKFHVRNDKASYNNDFVKFFQMGLFFICLIISFMLGAGGEFLRLLYRSNISSEGLQTIEYVSQLYSLSILGIFVYTIMGMVLLSSGKQKIYAVIGTVTQVIVIILNLLFYKILHISIFPISVFIAHLLAGFILYRWYPYKEPSIMRNLGKYILLLMVISLSIYIFKQYLFIESVYLRIFSLLLFQLCAVLLFSLLFKIEEVLLTLNKIKGVLK